MKKQLAIIIFILALTGTTLKTYANTENPIFSTDINITEIQNQAINTPLQIGRASCRERV